MACWSLLLIPLCSVEDANIATQHAAQVPRLESHASQFVPSRRFNGAGFGAAPPSTDEWLNPQDWQKPGPRQKNNLRAAQNSRTERVAGKNGDDGKAKERSDRERFTLEGSIGVSGGYDSNLDENPAAISVSSAFQSYDGQTALVYDGDGDTEFRADLSATYYNFEDWVGPAALNMRFHLLRFWNCATI